MKVTDEEIQKLTNQLKEWSVQIAVLATKQDAAAATAQKFAQELYELRAKHLAANQQLRELELHKSGMYMWENIGDGG
jgi:DNA helicase IV